MEDEKAVAELFGEMDVSEVEELLQKVMLYANLEGRAAEDLSLIHISKFGKSMETARDDVAALMSGSTAPGTEDKTAIMGKAQALSLIHI